MLYIDRLNKGLKVLDEVMPDWADHIDLDSLDMHSSSNCILGQLFGEFWFIDNVRALFNLMGSGSDTPYEWAAQHGFDNVGDAFHDHGIEADEFWKTAIHDRRA